MHLAPLPGPQQYQGLPGGRLQCLGGQQQLQGGAELVVAAAAAADEEVWDWQLRFAGKEGAGQQPGLVGEAAATGSTTPSLSGPDQLPASPCGPLLDKEARAALQVKQYSDRIIAACKLRPRVMQVAVGS
ncbi:hypothetical protein HaLaN_14875 [Haematococcus lacustris]|uniref:Uncharacterized protein n=1 Tax=Haematococcus lacustris TaxID=44745 RepID=A0A699ZFI5_HAELA|nr:hypothetical protein HaLaN_14875 [Haematococcus lacustris]